MSTNPDRVAVFIDNTNVYRRLKELKGTNPLWNTHAYNPLTLARKLAGNRNLVLVHFYCTPPPPYMLNDSTSKKNYSIQMRYYSEVQKLPGIEVKFGDLQLSGEKPKEKNLDTQLTADMLKMAAQNKFDTALLVSNDGDYKSAVEPTKNDFGKKIEIAYFKGHASSGLLHLADVSRRLRPTFFEQLPFKTDDL